MHQDFLPEIIRNDSMSTILDLIIGTRGVQIKEYACVCLGNILSLNNRQISSFVYKCGIIQTILELLQSPESTKIGSSMALFHFTSLIPATKKEVHELRGIPIFMEIIENNSTPYKVIEFLTGILMNLATNSETTISEMKEGNLNLKLENLRSRFPNKQNLLINISYLQNTLK
eukprot:TRINITY_DN2988_c0_g5_i2.p2 TRINITY_DN2988_c0_g5~~TRINITY_DN2988_c0_g5_i2.p2  ORF type:complete len:173 (-),score=19.32 TRINITY_DN2988_c0_g5_i2:50-568(-)